MKLKAKVFVERVLSFIGAPWQPFTRMNRSSPVPVFNSWNGLPWRSMQSRLKSWIYMINISKISPFEWKRNRARRHQDLLIVSREMIFNGGSTIKKASKSDLGFGLRWNYQFRNGHCAWSIVAYWKMDTFLCIARIPLSDLAALSDCVKSDPFVASS